MTRTAIPAGYSITNPVTKFRLKYGNYSGSAQDSWHAVVNEKKIDGQILIAVNYVSENILNAILKLFNPINV